MGEEDANQRWAAWLREQLGSRQQKFLTDRSGGKIAQGVVSRWLSGKSRPSPELAALVADIFGLDRSVALRSAGYDSLIPRGHTESPPPPDPVDPLDAEIEAMDLSKRAKRMIRERREQNLRELRELIKILRETEAEKGNAPDTAPVNSDDR